jgi:hypothetical protein
VDDITAVGELSTLKALTNLNINFEYYILFIFKRENNLQSIHPIYELDNLTALTTFSINF